MSITSIKFNGAERAYAGCIVTFRERTTGELRVKHRGGFSYIEHVNWKPERRAQSQEDVLRAMCMEASNWQGDWCVQSISTPSSVLADLQPKHSTRAGNVYEQHLLSRIDRLDMLDCDQSQTARNRNRRLGKQRGE